MPLKVCFLQMLYLHREREGAAPAGDYLDTFFSGNCWLVLVVLFYIYTYESMQV